VCVPLEDVTDSARIAYYVAKLLSLLGV